MNANIYSYIESVVGDKKAIIYVRDIDGKYVWVNDNFENILKLKLEDIKGKTNAEIYGVREAFQWEATDALAIGSNEPVLTQEFLNDAETNNLRRFISMKTTFMDRDNVLRLLGISVELTEESSKTIQNQIANLRNKVMSVRYIR